MWVLVEVRGSIPRKTPCKMEGVPSSFPGVFLYFQYLSAHNREDFAMFFKSFLVPFENISLQGVVRPAFNVSGNDCVKEPVTGHRDCLHSDCGSGFLHIPGAYVRPSGMDFCRQEADIYFEILLHLPL